ncbi:hypothetical protein GGS21DRAFT_377227 [Xylaria nigripes]|nr:hypothetical protein GGS21DRAFT_377227 [Xylaria nigripes]
MSLNGLDDAKVQVAYDAANAETSGWFLLKYASRHEIDILDSGCGGIADIRGAIEKYNEPSPLYGFLRYRRKSVIIKYMPEDCSRLIQARAAVHFTAICEQFTHDSTFEISNAKDLSDRKLSAACALHATSGSTSSTASSLRRQRSDEILEEEGWGRERKRLSVADEEERPTSSIYSDSPMPPSSPEPPVVLDSQQIVDSHETSFASTKNLPDFTGAAVPHSPTRSESSRRYSSQSSRLEVYSPASYTQGRKVKLGPRPSQENHKKSSAEENFRPVAVLPAGFKFKVSKKGKSQEQEQIEPPDYKPPASAPEPGLPQRSSDNQLPHRPATSSGASIKSNPLVIQPAKENKITPEKARLMKAIKLREKKLQEAKLERLAPTHQKFNGEDIAEETASNAKSEKELITQPSSGASAASAIDMPNPVTIKFENHPGDSALDSHPPSPNAASSTGFGNSTKASSLSELADEAIQAKELPQSNDDAVRSDGAGLSDIVEENSLQKSAPDVEENNTAEPAHTSQSGTMNSGEELARITESDAEISQNTGAVNRISIERDDNTADSGATLESKNFENVPVQEAVSVLHESGDPNSGGDKAKPNISVNQPNDPGRVDKTSVPTPSLGVPQSKPTNNSEESKSPTLQISSTTPTLKSKFSRSDAAIPAEPNDPPSEKTVITATTPKHELSKRYAPLKPNPEILVASPPKFTRQKITVEPIHTDLPTQAVPRIEAPDPLDDDALMDELQTATVQEAKPILVSKSPITPVFPSPSSPPKKEASLPRAASNPMRSSHLMPSDAPPTNTTRSASSGGVAFSSELSRQPSNASTASKKGNVGSSISQRIKALEALSSNPSDDRPRSNAPSATFFGVRKHSKREPSRSASALDQPESRIEDSRDPISDEAPTGGRERSSSVVSRLSVLEGQNRAARGSVAPNTPKDPDDTAPADLRQPTMLVDVQRAQNMSLRHPSDQSPAAERPQTGTSELYDPTAGSDAMDKQRKRLSSLSFMKNINTEHTLEDNNLTEYQAGSPLEFHSRPTSPHQSPGATRRLSASSRRSSIHEGDNASISGATRSSSRLSDAGSGPDDDQSFSDKKSKSRAARFMRRLSNSLGSARKSSGAAISPTLQEEDADQLDKAASTTKPQSSSSTVVAFMGDVNVQFPDNLLWKRRSMCLDGQGFLLLSSVQGAAKKAKDSIGTKSFYLGDFRKPYIPDVEVQELPNSVVLDFSEGSSLQIACGDRAAQQEVLRILQEAHQGHTALRN